MRRRRWCVHAALGVNSAVPAVRPYTVRKGDTVESIVKKRGVFQCVCYVVCWFVLAKMCFVCYA